MTKKLKPHSHHTLKRGGGGGEGGMMYCCMNILKNMPEKPKIYILPDHTTAINITEIIYFLFPSKMVRLISMQLYHLTK